MRRNQIGSAWEGIDKSVIEKYKVKRRERDEIIPIINAATWQEMAQDYAARSNPNPYGLSSQEITSIYNGNISAGTTSVTPDVHSTRIQYPF